MRDFFRSVRLGAAWLMGLALLSPLAAQSPVEQPAAEGTANIYNLDRDAGIGGVEKQWAWTAVDEQGECYGACVLVLAAGVRRTPAPENVGLQRMNFDQKEFVANVSSDKAKQKYTGVAKRVETYLARMGMPKKLFQEMSAQQSSPKVRLLDAAKLKTLGLDGTDPAYEQWLRENNTQRPPPSN
jgi:hypothetical protein